jgi:hypothetical protein
MMNERIKELLAQSGLQPYYDAQQGQIEKLIELVVKECSSVIIADGTKVSETMPKTTSTNYASNAQIVGRINAAVDYSDMIRQHFGIQGLKK